MPPRGRELLRVDSLRETPEAARALFHRGSSELDLESGPSSVLCLDHGIHLSLLHVDPDSLDGLPIGSREPRVVRRAHQVRPGPAQMVST